MTKFYFTILAVVLTNSCFAQIKYKDDAAVLFDARLFGDSNLFGNLTHIDITKIVDTSQWYKTRMKIENADFFIKVDPKDVQAYLDRADLFNTIHQYDDEVKDLDVVIAMADGRQLASAYMQKANVLDLSGMETEALDYFAKALVLLPNNGDIYYNRALCYTSIKKHDEANADFTQAIAFNSKDWMAYHSRGTNYYELKKYDLALQDFNACTAIYDDYLQTYISRAHLHFELGYYEACIADGKRSLEVPFQNYNMFILLGKAYAKVGKLQLACEQFDKAIKAKVVDAEKLKAEFCK
jgi:tetratricopeptide (TPR) repeat protein